MSEEKLEKLCEELRSFQTGNEETFEESLNDFLEEKTYIVVYRNNYDSAREFNNELINYIKQLKQENKELKEWKELHSGLILAKQNIKFCDENTQLKSVLKEIREYIKNTNFWGLYEDIPMSEVKYGDDILEIIDKGIGE